MIGAWAAIYGAIFPRNATQKDSVLLDYPKVWSRWHSECGLRVDFSEYQQDLIEACLIGENMIQYKGIQFKFVETYLR